MIGCCDNSDLRRELKGQSLVPFDSESGDGQRLARLGHSDLETVDGRDLDVEHISLISPIVPNRGDLTILLH